MKALDPTVVADRLRRGAALFRFMDGERAQQAMEGRLESDGALGRHLRSFDEAVAHRLQILRALNRRREAMRGAEAIERSSSSKG